MLSIPCGVDQLDPDVARQVELRVELMLEAFTATLGIAETFGPLMGLAVKNDQANFEKVRGAWAELSAADPQRCSTLRGLRTYAS